MKKKCVNVPPQHTLDDCEENSYAIMGKEHGIREPKILLKKKAIPVRIKCLFQDYLWLHKVWYKMKMNTTGEKCKNFQENLLGILPFQLRVVFFVIAFERMRCSTP